MLTKELIEKLNLKCYSPFSFKKIENILTKIFNKSESTKFRNIAFNVIEWGIWENIK